jgi:hypothetical protein
LPQVRGLDAAFSSVGSIPGDFILDASWTTYYSKFPLEFLPCFFVNHHSITAAYSSITTPCDVRELSPNVHQHYQILGFSIADFFSDPTLGCLQQEHRAIQ